ncbi:MAG TPA: hypothetical protein VF170_04155 [Planctomycetaceae bacterium]
MRAAGKRLKQARLVQTDRYVVAVEVELVIPDGDRSEPCFEPETLRFLREVTEHAERGDVDWLRRHGRVYEAVDAA